MDEHDQWTADMLATLQATGHLDCGGTSWNHTDPCHVVCRCGTRIELGAHLEASDASSS